MRTLKRIARKVRGYLVLPLIFMIMAMLSVPVFAAYDYYVPISIRDNTATPVTNIPVLVTINSSNLNVLGYILVTALDTDVQESASVPYSVGTSRLGIFVSTLSAYQTRVYNYFLTYDPAQVDYDLITGFGGNVTTVDHNDLELGDNFTIELKGFIDTDAGGSKNLISKDYVFKIYISGATDITADINAGTKTVTATGVASGDHTINVIADGVNMKIYVDTVEEDSVALAGTSVTDNTTAWVVGENDVLPYVEYLKIWTAN